MAKRKRRRRLTSLNIEEISWVDRPANQTPFLFWKNEEGDPVEPMEPTEDIEDFNKQFKGFLFSFATDGTTEGTKVIVNRRKIENLTDLNLSYYPIDSLDVGVASALGLRFGYTVKTKGKTRDGFISTRTYRLSKGEVKEAGHTKADEQDIAILKGLHPEISEEIDGELAKVLATHSQTIAAYKDEMPASLQEAITNIIKVATETEVEEDIEMTEETGADNKEIQTEDKTASPIDTDKLVEAMKPAMKEVVIEVLTDRDTKASQAAKDAEDAKAAEAKAEAEAQAAKDKEEPPADEEEMVEVDTGELAQQAMNEVLAEAAATGSA